jgi:hypothetical protein
MGLDQYAHRRDSNGESTELSYWRKHNALQGWMEKLWAIKTGKSESDLNSQDLEITAEDLDQLWTSIKHQTLPKTQGFFFGSDTSHAKIMIWSLWQKLERPSQKAIKFFTLAGGKFLI